MGAYLHNSSAETNTPQVGWVDGSSTRGGMKRRLACCVSSLRAAG